MSSSSEPPSLVPIMSRQTHQCLQLSGGIAALLAAVVFRRWLSAEFGMLQTLGIVQLHPQAATPLEWLTLLHAHRFLGLLLLNFFDLTNYLLATVMYLGISAVVINHNRSYARAAMVFTIAGAAIYLASQQSFNLLSLSNQYFSLANDSQGPLILAAAQYALTVNDPVVFGTGTFWSYMAFYLAGMLLSIAMLQIDRFKKWIGILGIVANAFGLCYFATSLFGPALSIIPAVGSAPANLLWYIAAGIQLLRNPRREATLNETGA